MAPRSREQDSIPRKCGDLTRAPYLVVNMCLTFFFTFFLFFGVFFNPHPVLLFFSFSLQLCVFLCFPGFLPQARVTSAMKRKATLC